VLNLPFSLLLLEVGFHFGLWLLLKFRLRLGHFHWIRLADALMFVHPVRHEGASTLAAGDQIPDLLRTHLRFEGVTFGWCLQGLFRLRLLPHRSFINVGLPDHGVRLAGLLVGD
jgi:hypothetical protein